MRAIARSLLMSSATSEAVWRPAYSHRSTGGTPANRGRGAEGPFGVRGRVAPATSARAFHPLICLSSRGRSETPRPPLTNHRVLPASSSKTPRTRCPSPLGTQSKLVTHLDRQSRAKRFPTREARRYYFGALSRSDPWLRAVLDAVGHVTQHDHHLAVVSGVRRQVGVILPPVFALRQVAISIQRLDVISDRALSAIDG